MNSARRAFPPIPAYAPTKSGRKVTGAKEGCSYG